MFMDREPFLETRLLCIRCEESAAKFFQLQQNGRVKNLVDNRLDTNESGFVQRCLCLAIFREQNRSRTKDVLRDSKVVHRISQLLGKDWEDLVMEEEFHGLEVWAERA